MKIQDQIIKKQEKLAEYAKTNPLAGQALNEQILKYTPNNASIGGLNPVSMVVLGQNQILNQPSGFAENQNYLNGNQIQSNNQILPQNRFVDYNNNANLANNNSNLKQVNTGLISKNNQGQIFSVIKIPSQMSDEDALKQLRHIQQNRQVEYNANLINPNKNFINNNTGVNLEKNSNINSVNKFGGVYAPNENIDNKKNQDQLIQENASYQNYQTLPVLKNNNQTSSG